MKKIIPSICMLLVTAVLMGTSTYAWFSMNREVKATGMKVTASTSANLVITGTAGANFSDVDSFIVEWKDTTATVLAPVSSKDGKKFFTTAAAAEANTGFDVKDGAVFTKVNDAGTSTAKYYYTKTVYIGVKGVNGLGQLKVKPVINTTTIGGTGVAEKNDIYKALRIAVFAKDQNSTVFAGDLSSRTNWNPIVKEGTKGTDAGLTEAGTTTAVTGTGVALAGLETLEKETWYEISIFVWLDGQDEACTANNANIANVNIANLTIDFVFTAENAVA